MHGIHETVTFVRLGKLMVSAISAGGEGKEWRDYLLNDLGAFSNKTNRWMTIQKSQGRAKLHSGGITQDAEESMAV